jgi:hypothetical protein
MSAVLTGHDFRTTATRLTLRIEHYGVSHPAFGQVCRPARNGGSRSVPVATFGNFFACVPFPSQKADPGR